MLNKILFYGLLFIAAFLLSYFLVPFFKKLSLKLNILDVPEGNRKIHDKPMALLGGWAIYISFLICLLIVVFIKSELVSRSIGYVQVLAIIIAGLIIMIMGTLDDKYNLSAKKQLFWVIVACFIIVVSGVAIKFITRPGGGVIDLTLGIKENLFGANFYLIGSALTFLWLIIMTNSTKLLDGLDGLSSGVVFIGMIILFIVSLFWDKPDSLTSVLTILFAGAILGFLVFNFYPAKIFLGNGGSNLLGLYLGVFAIISGAKIATALLVMGVAIIDMFWVVIQRLFKKEAPFRHADRKHLHFRLLDFGFSHRQSVLIIYFISLFFGTISLFQNTTGKIIMTLFLILFMFFLFFYINHRNEKV